VARGTVFNTRRRKLLRTTIPAGESLVGLVVLGVLVAIVAWVAAQRDAFDPDQRDLPVELLDAERPAIPIYDRPLKPWVEPGTEFAAVGPGAGLTPYPAEIAGDDWQPKGRVRSFDPGNLYEKINGEAEKFVKQGFVSMHYLVLRAVADGTELAIELYDQGDLGGSTGIFSEHAGSGREIAERGGVTYFLTTAGVVGRTGRWFFRAAADRSTEAVLAKAEALVDALANLGGEAQATRDAAPAGLRVLRRAGVSEALIEYQASNVFKFDFASDFWFGRLDDAGDARVFVHEAESPEAAAQLREAIVEEQSYDYEDARATEEATMMRHGFLGTWFAIAREGRYLLGVEGVADEQTMRSALGRIAEALAE
jgi:hypothetical protein